MDPLILYPSKDRLKVAAMAAAALVVVPFVINFVGLGGVIPQFPMLSMASMGGGAVLFYNVMKAQRVSVPVFAADAYGFSIRGGRKLPWDQFKGADTMPFDTAIKIGTGESKLRPHVEIKTLELSGPAREMVSQIEDYAATAGRAAVMGSAVTLGAKRVARDDAVPPTLEEISGFGPAVAAVPIPARVAPVQTAATTVAPMVDPDGGLLPLELFPSDASRLKGFALGLVALFFAYKLAGAADVENAVWLVWVFGGLGVIGVGASVWSYLRPRPSFAADIDGFSVRGKRKRSWDDFRSVNVHTVRYWFIPVARNVVIRTGKSVIGGRQHIPNYLMSGSAKEMAAEIAQYVRAVQVERQNGAAAVLQRTAPVMAQAAPQPAKAQRARPNAQQPAAPRPTRNAQPQGDPFMARLQESGGAITSVPRMSERIFGRRKVN